MNIRPRISLVMVLCPLAVLWCVLAGAPRLAAGQNPPPPAPNSDVPAPNAPPARSLANSRITIEVTGGEKNAAVENASVYVKYVEEHAIKKDKKLELNVKTSREGVAHVANAPLGRVLIQVVADGWKSYGRWYDITDANQQFKIHLDRPPKWY
jgi:hypothetical protein